LRADARKSTSPRKRGEVKKGKWMLYDLLIGPFLEYEFMRRALAGAFALAIGAAPIGVFLMLRRMSLIGDAMAHAILPGAAIGYLFAGLSLFAMAGGGLIAGFIIAVGAGLIARATEVKEDASLAAFFLISLALGVTIVATQGTNVDLLHFLFGSVLAVDDPTLLLMVSISSISTILLALIWRPLVLECVDPGFLRSVSRAGGMTHIAFLLLVVMNLIGGFQALGTLLAVGIMMLPAVICRFWARDITRMLAIAVACAAFAGYAGLLLSFHASLPSGPAVILVAGAIYVLSVLVGPVGGLVWRLVPMRHLEA
jgi:zinc/manganese transport system permease protein